MSEAILKEATRLYQELVKRAELNEAGDLMFRGKITEVYHSLTINPSYYSAIRKTFEEFECLTYVQKGARGQPSLIRLIQPPPLDAEISPGSLTTRSSAAMITRRVETLEAWRETITGGGLNIPEALRNFEKRIVKLEAQLNEVNNEPQA